MSEIQKLFDKSELRSSKYKKYFLNYDEILSRFKGKDIKIIEIGVQDGGSLKIWQEYFGSNSKIFGVDLNPQCKKFEKDNIKIFIGSQSSKNFWSKLFNQVGKVDLIIDDGGHTNAQQVITAVNCIPNINDGGMLITEDVHSSYLKRFGNPSKYSFINFIKKTIDDINSLYPNLKKFNFSLNQFVYSIQNFESMAVFYIDRKRCKPNDLVINKGKQFNHIDFRDNDNKSKMFKKFKILTFLKKKLSFLNYKKYFN